MNSKFTQIDSYISHQISQYKQFMSIDCFPELKISVISTFPSSCTQSGYVPLAEHKYIVNNHSHILEIQGSILNDFHADYLLYHEFTHAYDIFKYANNDANMVLALNAFTEYHAAQIDLIKLLNFPSIDYYKPFFMTSHVKTVFGECSVIDYINDRYSSILSLVARKSFQSDCATLTTLLGLIFNYFGYISICHMYAVDFSNYRFSFNVIKEIIPTDVVERLINMLNKWLTPHSINILCDGYATILQNLLYEYNFLKEK